MDRPGYLSFVQLNNNQWHLQDLAEMSDVCKQFFYVAINAMRLSCEEVTQYF